MSPNLTDFFCISFDSALAFSNEHNVLVWTLNFYTIESTSKYIPECEMVTNTIISANNVLKRTTSLALYSCIIHVSVTRTSVSICKQQTVKYIFNLLEIGIGKSRYLEDNYKIFS